MRIGLRLAAAVAGGAALAASGASASAAMLKITVDPTVVHKNQTYAITIAGRYHHRGQQTTPRLLAFIQYTGAPCRPTATAEYALPGSEWSWLVYPQISVNHRIFRHVFYERARTRYGNRRVCAYLYATTVTPQTTAAPLLRAGAPYSEAEG